MRPIDPIVIRYPDSPIVFIHIPKTSGTSFTKYLYDNMRTHDVIGRVFTGNWEEVQIERRLYDLYTGHFSLASIRKFDRPYHFVTFLREPVARAVSQWKSWHDQKNLTPEWRAVMQPHEIEALEMAQTMRCSDFFMSDNAHIVDNISNIHTQYLADFTEDYGTMDAARNAMYNLKHNVLYFGLTEQFRASIALFRKVFTGTIPYVIPRGEENRSTVEDEPLTKAASERVRSLNKADVVLYEFARELFAARCAHYGIELD